MSFSNVHARLLGKIEGIITHAGFTVHFFIKFPEIEFPNSPNRKSNSNGFPLKPLDTLWSEFANR